jgi:serine/threonine protein kinase
MDFRELPVEVGRRIEGGRHEVHEVTLHGKHYAAKFFREKGGRDEEYRKHMHIVRTLDERLKAEVQKLKCEREYQAEALRLEMLHNSIRRVFEYSDKGSYCIVLQLEGQSMEKQLTSESANPPSDFEVLGYAHQLIGALSCIHKAGFHHNDLNTDNILQKLVGGGYVIIDFGESGVSGSGICKDRHYSQYSPPDRNRDCRGSFDVCSLASVLVELFVWGVLGDNDPVGVLQRFREERGNDQREHQQDILDMTERFYINAEKLSPSVKTRLSWLGEEIPEVVKVLEEMLHVDPDKRPTASEAFVSFDKAIRRHIPPQHRSNGLALLAC